MNKWTRGVALCAVSAFAVIQAQALTYDFTTADGFVDGNLTNQVNGWGGADSYTLDTSGGGTLNMTDVTNQAWQVAFPSNTFDAAANNVFSVSNVVSWSQAITNGNNSIFNIMINDAVGGGTPARLTLDKRNNFPEQYTVSMKSDDDSTYDWTIINESDLGLNGLADPNSDELALSFTAKKEETQNNWTYSFEVRNLTTASVLVSKAGAMTSSSNLYDAATLYPGISSGVKVEQSGATNRVVKSFTINESYVAPPAPTTTIVQWGETGGDTNIVVAASQNLEVSGGVDRTYVEGHDATVNPVNPGYYTNVTAGTRSTVFNMAADNSWGTRKVSNNTDGDALVIGHNKAKREGMFVWEDFLTTDTTLSMLSIEIRRNFAGATNGTYRFVIQKGESGAWYASDAMPLEFAYSSGIAVDASSLNWNEFTPFNNSAVTIGAAATIDMTDITAVGYYFYLDSVVGTYASCEARYFKATAIEGTPVNYVKIFDIDFQDHNVGDWWTDYGTAPLRAWTYGGITEDAGGDRYLEQRPGYGTNDNIYASSQDDARRGQLFTNAIPALAAGDVYEFSLDYRMFAETNVVDQKFFDAIVTTNNHSGHWTTPNSEQAFGQADGSLDPAVGAYQLGFRLEQDNWTKSGERPDGSMLVRLNPAAATTHAGTLNLNDIGITNVTGGGAADYSSDTLRLTYQAEKTTNANVWACSLTVYNPANDMTWVFSESVTNAVVYGATDLYLGLASREGFDGVAGYELDNLYSKILVGGVVAEPTPWESFVSDYGLIGGQDDDEDLDGVSNFMEYVFGGNPTNPAVKGSIPVLDTATGDVNFGIRADTSLEYTVQTAPALDNPTVWTTIAGPTPIIESDGGIDNYSQNVGTAGNELFIQVIVQ